MKLKRILIPVSILLLALLLVFMIPRIGTSGRNLKEKSRKDFTIASHWQTVEEGNKTMVALLHYNPKSVKENLLSLYTKPSPFHYGYFFHSSGEMESFLGKGIYQVVGPSKESLLLSLNEEKIVTVVFQREKDLVKVSVDKDRPFVVSVPKDAKTIQLFNTLGKSVHVKEVKNLIQ